VRLSEGAPNHRSIAPYSLVLVTTRSDDGFDQVLEFRNTWASTKDLAGCGYVSQITYGAFTDNFLVSDHRLIPSLAGQLERLAVRVGGMLLWVGYTEEECLTEASSLSSTAKQLLNHPSCPIREEIFLVKQKHNRYAHLSPCRHELLSEPGKVRASASSRSPPPLYQTASQRSISRPNLSWVRARRSCC
jgi:hypothetical protein